MLILTLIVAFILLLIVILVAVVRRHDAESYTDQERDPFHIEMARLAAAGLLYEQSEKTSGRGRKSYTITPAGEAALRTWLREPMNDPGMLRLYFAGIVGPADVVALARQQSNIHRQRSRQYDRIEDLLEDHEDWESARKIADLGRQFEERCERFWSQQADGPMRGRALSDGRGERSEEDESRSRSERKGEQRSRRSRDNDDEPDDRHDRERGRRRSRAQADVDDEPQHEEEEA